MADAPEEKQPRQPSTEPPAEQPSPPPSPQPAQRWMAVLEPGRFAQHPQVDAVLKGGPPLTPEQAKEVVAQIIADLHGILPTFEILRHTLEALAELKKAVDVITDAVAQADEALLDAPSLFALPDHEFAHRAGRLIRRMIEKRSGDVRTPEQFAAIKNEAFRRVRTAMSKRGAAPTREQQDDIPIAFLHLRYGLSAITNSMQFMARPAAALESYLRSGLAPLPTSGTSGRPSLDMAMYFAWILQDATTRGMTDERVAVFLADAFAALPPEWAKLVPSRAAVERWRLEREKIPKIPHHNRPHKRR